MQIVMQVLGRLMAQFLIVYTLVKGLLFTLVSKLRVSITQVYQSVANLQILNLLAKIKQSINHLVAHLTIQAQLMKVGLMNVLHKVGRVGQQLLTTARQIRQLVPTAQSPRKGKPVGITKSARSHLSVSKTAQTNTVNQLIQDGTKYQGRAKRHRQRVKQPLKAKP